jgi:FMN phosphatase YigB (HAD superfamily)
MDDITLISTDVFDTLLLRGRRSERSRIVMAETWFCRVLSRNGFTMRPDDLVRARLYAQKFAYRALNVGEVGGEVELREVIRRQLNIVGLPDAFVDERLAIELTIEKQSLSANGHLAMVLREQRQAGIRVVAISDTGLPADRLEELINYFHGPGLIDKVYSSADLRATKRHGGLFRAVLEAENVLPRQMVHIGDDQHADVHVPGTIGINTLYLHRNRIKRYLTRADGAQTEILRTIRRPPDKRLKGVLPNDSRSFGREVFGPIVAQFCLFIWLYAQQAKAGDTAVLLFCARGGLGIREAFERLLPRLGLSLDLRRDNLLVSRLVAARSAVMTRSPAVLDELGREFHGRRFIDVARALGGHDYQPSPSWEQRFDQTRFFAMLETASGAELLDDIRTQNSLFAQHLHQVAGDAKRIILCDTGLYGSTQRLLAAGFPDLQFETIQFARCNYKGLSEDHFPKVSGLVVEDNLYNPLRVETVILRYWQILENLFEPAIPSVRHFSRDADGTVIANAGDIRYGQLDPARDNMHLSGVLDYIGDSKTGSLIDHDATRAWRRLRQAITNPSRSDVLMLDTDPRSVDFGKPELVRVMEKSDSTKTADKLRALKSQLWREGAIARDFPVLKPALLTALELAHIVRGASAHFRR